jgi:hypothetical protein
MTFQEAKSHLGLATSIIVCGNLADVWGLADDRLLLRRA